MALIGVALALLAWLGLRKPDPTVYRVVASELPVRLILNGQPFVTLLCTPSELQELAVGFLLSEGLLRERGSIRRLDVNEKDISVLIELDGLPNDWDKMSKKRRFHRGADRE